MACEDKQQNFHLQEGDTKHHVVTKHENPPSYMYTVNGFRFAPNAMYLIV
jgi:hypothetical protein